MKETSLWLLQRVTGFFLILMLVVHFSVEHFSGQIQRLEYDFVLNRISSPWWKAFDMTFLVVLLYHGFYGLWGIALEYVKSKKSLQLCKAAIVLSCASLLLTGIYIITL